MANRRYAGRIAGRKARASYRGGMRMSKRRLAKTYATKVGQTTYRAIRSQRPKRRFGRFRRTFKRFFKRRRY